MDELRREEPITFAKLMKIKTKALNKEVKVVNKTAVIFTIFVECDQRRMGRKLRYGVQR